MTDLFATAAPADTPAGGPHPLADMVAERRLSSLILWGPPGTIARLLADETDLAFEQASAIFTGVAELKKVFEAAKLRHAAVRRRDPPLQQGAAGRFFAAH